MANEDEEEKKNMSEEDKDEEQQTSEVAEEEEDDAQFDDPEGFVDSISDKGEKTTLINCGVATCS